MSSQTHCVRPHKSRIFSSPEHFGANRQSGEINQKDCLPLLLSFCKFQSLKVKASQATIIFQLYLLPCYDDVERRHQASWVYTLHEWVCTLHVCECAHMHTVCIWMCAHAYCMYMNVCACSLHAYECAWMRPLWFVENAQKCMMNAPPCVCCWMYTNLWKPKSVWHVCRRSNYLVLECEFQMRVTQNARLSWMYWLFFKWMYMHDECGRRVYARKCRFLVIRTL